MDIAQVVKQSGIPASTLRYYEEKGLIASVGRQGLRRTFSPNILERLALISLGQAAGFTLDEISLMFTSEGGPRIDRKMLLEKAEQIDRTIQQLSAMRDGLKHVAACSAPSHLECHSFRRLMKAASAGVIGPRKRTRKAFVGSKA